ncbi:MAG: TlpA family protein disulfide reductase [bacterium]|nr:TlpA family protein disulfide reductase [bacterium]
MVLRILIAACLTLTAACTADVGPSGPDLWHAWLDSPGGDLPFGLELALDGEKPRAWLLNGPERIEVPRVENDGGVLTLGIDFYGSRVEARWVDDAYRLEGNWTRKGLAGRETTLAFHATRGARRRFERGGPAGPASEIDGRWSVEFADDDLPAVGEFEARDDGSVSGTFLTATGDYRFLAGTYDARRLRLSVFDGAHAFLFDARLRDDGTLAGDFWSRDTWHETWTATRDDRAAVPDPFGETLWVGGIDLSEIAYPDLDGRPRTLADPEFAGSARVIEVFGSWCPNCNDATELLVELDERYRSRGLRILGLAFEMTGDFERDAEQVRTYARHHGIEYPLLVAGTADKAEASAAFPLIDRVRAFPTTIFLDATGRVRAVHSGFSGPAAGAAHEALRGRFESLIEEMLDPAQGS